MARTVALDQQYFNEIRERNLFYIDKTAFIRDWWNAGDRVTLITRPRRFGKTLMMSTVEQFFSSNYANRADLFTGLEIWQDETFRAIQGTYPVIFLSLASVKGKDFFTQRKTICQQIISLYTKFEHKVSNVLLNENEQKQWNSVRIEMDDAEVASALHFLCMLLSRVYGKKTIILLDEYDTPLLEAWVKGFWQEMVEFLRGLFNATFKTNEYLERAILTGITRVSKESLFSDFNNLRVVGITTEMYETAFGFTEEEVFATMDEYGLSDRKGVTAMYDGFTFGKRSGIYNPWSVLCYLQEKTLKTWWANTSSNALAGKLVREGEAALKQDFMDLLEGKSIPVRIDEQIVFDRLSGSPEAVWSLLMASGYLKPVAKSGDVCELQITNGEVRRMFEGLVQDWFAGTGAYGNFIKALMSDDLDFMNEYMNKVAIACFSSFDTGGLPERTEPERFYHGFVLGLLVDLRDRYIVTSNRESGLGRYDVILEPRNPSKDKAFIFEFKVHKARTEKSLKETVAAALAQIEAREYAQQLVERGIPVESIRKYGFAFRGKEVLIG